MTKANHTADFDPAAADDAGQRAEFSRRARQRAADYDWPAVAEQAKRLFSGKVVASGLGSS